MKNPLVSIIVPVYNVEKYLRRCLDSIISQTYQNIEIILVDDGSKDTSGQICDEYASKDSRIRVIHKENQGVALARMTGFEQSSGDLISFIDSDDYIDLQYIGKLEKPFEIYNIDLSSCDNFLVINGTICLPKRTIRGLYNREHINKLLRSQYLYDKNVDHAGMPIYLVTKMIRRSYIANALRIGEGLWWGEDQIALFYIINHINSMYSLSEALYYYIKYEDNRQASKIYNASLWTNQLECWRRYKHLDKNNFLYEQLPLKMWWTSIRTFRMMSLSIKNYSEFKKDLNILDGNPMWSYLLKNNHLAQGKREKLAFFFLKYKLYYPFYKILLHKL